MESQVSNKTVFAPMLSFRNCAAGIAFYQQAFDAVELRRWSNDDGSVHVGEMSINGAVFHLHEENANGYTSPESLGGCPIIMGLFVDDPHATMARAVAAGAKEVHPVKDYDYGYRQGRLTDPFGYSWELQKVI